ncbi:YciI family protein [Luteimonas lutimaris]|uniref:YCII-related domain-containing protein n=1 Tax=Luteimonas lutimaris TaxID=698645 RepID=A0ABP7LZH6_9GAMM|nr:YciI family protein [Luteimonas sp.]
MKRYLVLTLRKPAFDPAMIEPHYAHLDRLRAQGRLELAGPFSDRSGGAYLLLAGSLDDAIAAAHADPLHESGSSEVIVHEWDAK